MFFQVTQKPQDGVNTYRCKTLPLLIFLLLSLAKFCIQKTNNQDQRITRNSVIISTPLNVPILFSFGQLRSQLHATTCHQEPASKKRKWPEISVLQNYEDVPNTIFGSIFLLRYFLRKLEKLVLIFVKVRNKLSHTLSHNQMWRSEDVFCTLKRCTFFSKGPPRALRGIKKTPELPFPW